MKNFYKNPLTKVYQYEYAIYSLLTGYFKSTECNSRAIESLRIYYSELVSVSATGKCSYEKQYELEEKCKALIHKCISGKVRMPHASRRHAKVIVTPNPDKTHTFTFQSGKDSFSYRFVIEEVKDEEPEKEKKNQDLKKAEDKPKQYRVILKVAGAKSPQI
ncbi:MAG: hypothetical protein IKO32_13080 [Lachnospiraceae bacterium]|nr:hypothetical protein [Lachnospiraceae bacterium]